MRRARFCRFVAGVSAAAALISSAAGWSQPVPWIAGHKSAKSASTSPLMTREVSGLPDTPGCTVDPDRELFIIDLSVVRDCFRTTWLGPCPVPDPPATRGAWTVGGLLPGIFGTTDAVQLSNLTKQWLGEWKVQKTINSDVVPARPAVQSLVIDPWQTASGGSTLAMSKAPFRLLAIVFRLDLRRSSGYSSGGTAGEARFVYNLLDAAGHDAGFTLILEYGLDAPTCADIQSWAQTIHALGAIPFGASYNAALQAITDRFTTIGASPGKPNGSAINQVRTNEAFLDAPWELREFKLRSGGTVQTIAVDKRRKAASQPAPLPLLQATVAQTPAAHHNFSQLFADYVNANAPAIVANNYTVPLSFQSQPFRGGAAPNQIDHWDGPPPACSSIADAQARHVASLNTCNGCHGDEGGVFFRQVALTGPGGGALLSSFLTGGVVEDLCGLQHQFGDIERRRVDLCHLLEEDCQQIEDEQPASFVH
jgi:hypothetical protein